MGGGGSSLVVLPIGRGKLSRCVNSVLIGCIDMFGSACVCMMCDILLTIIRL